MTGDLLPGRATPEGTAAYAEAHPVSEGHYRAVGGLTLSSLGMGSYLGEVGEAENRAYEEAALYCLQNGVNVLDTAANYRDQQSERDLGRAIRRHVEAGGDRAGFLVSSKAGFIHGDAAERDTQTWLEREYLAPGVFERSEVAANCHVLSPSFVLHQLERSRRNLGLGTIDVYYVHNPETQLGAGLPEEAFYTRMGEVFEALEGACEEGRIRAYGCATWTGLRMPPDHPEHMSLLRLVHEAGEAHVRATGGKASGHRFRAIQLPVNLAMTEAIEEPSQPWKMGQRPVLDCAADAGLYVMASAGLAQTRLAGHVPESWQEALGTGSELETCLQFARSVPGVHTALVGMGRPEHAREDVGWAAARPPAEDVVRQNLLGDVDLETEP